MRCQSCCCTRIIEGIGPGDISAIGAVQIGAVTVELIQFLSFSIHDSAFRRRQATFKLMGSTVLQILSSCGKGQGACI